MTNALSRRSLLGKSLLGATALGFYALALNLASWPVSMF